jgi:hypothetical protein
MHSRELRISLDAKPEHRPPPAIIRNDNSIRRDIQIDAYSIEEFCRRHSIDGGTLYNMKTAGSGPRETRAIGRFLITKESAQEWRTRQ